MGKEGKMNRNEKEKELVHLRGCLLYTSDAADE